jgi:hypothetical protein
MNNSYGNIEFFVNFECFNSNKCLNVMIQIRQKRVRLDNGKSIVVDVPANQNGKDPFNEAARLISKIPNIQPCN